jgi:hypothetical protein
MLVLGHRSRLASAPTGRSFSFLALVVEQVGHATELFRSGLQSFDLLA